MSSGPTRPVPPGDRTPPRRRAAPPPPPTWAAVQLEGTRPDAWGIAVRDDAAGLALLAEARLVDGDPGVVEAAARMAADRVRAHLLRHQDLRERLVAHPDDALRSRLRQVAGEALAQASREIWALAHRRRATVAVHVDLVVLAGAEAVVGHAGEGRAVLLHAGLAHQLTERGVRAAEGETPGLRLDDAPPGASDDDGPAPGLGESADPPRTEVLVVDLQEGDRLLLLGASAAAGLPTAGMARVALGATAEQSLRAALNAAGGDRPRVGVAVQLGDVDTSDQASERLALLRGIDLFKWCGPDELLGVVGLTEPRHYVRGELLLRQGRLNTTLFLLIAGRVGVNKDGTRIAETGEGSVFGEMSMLDSPKASATVEALTDVEVLAIPRDAFLRALKSDASMAVKVLWSLLLRVSSNLRTTSKELARLKGLEESYTEALADAPTERAPPRRTAPAAATADEDVPPSSGSGTPPRHEP